MADFTSHGISLQDVADKIAVWEGEVHMATLAWVANGQDWKALDRCVAALEIFPDENEPSKHPADCIWHAHAEGLTKVTLMLKTKAPNTRATYGEFFNVCHSLYTADDITPIAPAWLLWRLDGDCTKPIPPTPPPPVSVRFTRVLDKGDVGIDCEAVGRALCLAGVGVPIRTYQKLPLKTRRTFGPRKVTWLNKFKKQAGLKQDGVYDKATHLLLAGFFDARARKQMADWEPPPPPLVAPKQGSSSLVQPLWEEFSMGRNMGLTDQGTYNSRSVLPGTGTPSDHASSDGVHIRPPARAFDLGFSPQIGQAHALARSFFNAMIDRPEVEYVILGNKIWSRSKGLHAYTAGGHEGHVHVSGRH